MYRIPYVDMASTDNSSTKLPWFLVVILAIALLSVVVYVLSDFSGNSNDNRGLPVRNQDNSLKKFSDTNNDRIPVRPDDAPSQPSVPSGSIALFYRAYLGEVANRLPVSVQNTADGSGYVTNIRWETSHKGVVRFIPVVDRFDVMASTVSTSYSESTIYPMTQNGRLFTVTRRSTSTVLNEGDPKNASAISSTTFDATNLTVVGDKVYYRDRIVNDFYGRRSGGGALVVQSLGTASGSDLLSYGAADNDGDFFTAQNALVSVVTDYDSEPASIRRHDLFTGKVSEELFSNVSSGTFFSGSDALYGYVKNGSVYTVKRFGLDGTAKSLIEVALDSDEKGLSIDEDSGKLLIVSYGSDYLLKSAQLYDVASNSTEEISIVSSSGLKSQEYAFVFLN